MSITSFTAATKSATVGVGDAAAAAAVMPHSSAWSFSERAIASVRVEVLRDVEPGLGVGAEHVPRLRAPAARG